VQRVKIGRVVRGIGDQAKNNVKSHEKRVRARVGWEKKWIKKQFGKLAGEGGNRTEF